jgi:hypothetical protein
MKTKYEVLTVSLKDILNDNYFQHRESTLDKSLPDLREKYKAGVRFDDIDLLEKPNGKFQIVSGFHQIKATRLEAGDDASIQARVHRALTKAEAMRISVRSNRDHGSSLSLKDRRNAVRCLLREDPYMTDAEIHDLTHACLRTVAYQRNKVPGAKTEVRRGRDGKLKKARPIKKKADTSVSSDAEDDSALVPCPVKEDLQMVFNLDLMKDQPKQKEPTILEKSELINWPSPEKVDAKSLPELLLIAKICRMQARELERRAHYIEKLSEESLFTKAELELIRFVAEDAEAMEVVDSGNWDDRFLRLKAISVFISQILATDDEAETAS